MMILTKTFIFFAVSCVTAVASASSNNFASAASLDKILHQGNGNYIIQLNQSTCIKHFVPRFIDSALDIFTQSIGLDKVEKKNNTRIVRRDTQDDQVHVFDAYDLGNSFKGITVKFEDLDIVKSLLTSFGDDILNIIPDLDIKFDLSGSKKAALRKRYYIRTSKKAPSSQRAGNFDYDNYEHDENCPFAHDDEDDDDNLSINLPINKRAATITTKKKTTTTAVKGTTSTCYPGSSGKKKGDGYNGYCCTSSDDCKDTCLSNGKCNGSVNTKTTKAVATTKTTTKAATTTSTSSACYPGSAGKKKGDGYSGYCCTSSDDCKDTCLSNGKCNGPVNTKTTPLTTTAAKTTITTTTTTTTATTTTAATPSPTANAANDVKQTGANWNLVRASEHKLDLTQPYIYDNNAGSDAYVYVIDDGMNINHVEFEGRATWGYSAYSGVSQLGEGHGTHVAGIVGSKTYGIAKKTNLIAVQVLQSDGTGSISSLLAGLQWVQTDAQKHKGKAIINMSLGLQTGGQVSSSYTAFDNAVTGIVQSGVPLFAAAGNWETDTCQVLPGGNKNAFAVAATDNTDTMAWYSNYGTCISLFAPGSDILSTYITSNTSTTTMSGTSMASPHAAGIAALFIGQMNGPAPATLYNKITSLATAGVVKSIVGTTSNLLVFNGQQLTTN